MHCLVLVYHLSLFLHASFLRVISQEPSEGTSKYQQQNMLSMEVYNYPTIWQPESEDAGMVESRPHHSAF